MKTNSRNYQSSIRRFQRSRKNRLQFKRNQRKLWLMRLAQLAKKSNISRKIQSQLNIYDPTALIILNLIK